MNRTTNNLMTDVQSALEKIAKLSAGCDVMFYNGIWTIEANVKEIELQVQHENLWYAANNMLDKVRANLVFPKPVMGEEWMPMKHGWHVGLGNNFCMCGCPDVEARGWEQKGTPCHLTEYRCKHGHQWTGYVNCD